MRSNYNLLLLLFAAGASPAAAHPGAHEAAAALEERFARSPCDAGAFLERGERYRADGDWAAAAADYDRAEGCDPSLAVVERARGQLALERGAPADALLALDRYLARAPSDALAHRLRAEALTALNRPLEAAESWRRALAIAPPGQPASWLGLARALADAGDRRGAVQALDDGMDCLGPVTVLTREAAAVERRAGRVDAALLRVLRAAEGAPRPEPWLVLSGEIQECSGRVEEAHAAYAKALKALSKRPRGHTPAMLSLQEDLLSALHRTDPTLSDHSNESALQCPEPSQPR